VARDTARDGDCGFEALPLRRDAALRMRHAVAAAIEASLDLRAAFVEVARRRAHARPVRRGT
jgi:hypothetical protein